MSGLGPAALRLFNKVLAEGGWWTASELALDLQLPAEEVRVSMRDLVHRRVLAQRMHPVSGLQRVGVTAHCVCPLAEQVA